MPAASDEAASALVEATLFQAARPARVADDMRELAAAPHPAASAENARLARYIAKIFRDLGYQVEERSYEVLVPVPSTCEVEMVEPVAYVASLREKPTERDFDTAGARKLTAPVLAYSEDGEIEAPVVYANYGRVEDYRELAARGIQSQGHIVLVRRGAIDDFVKVGLAESAGAVGIIVYGDPSSGGFAEGIVAPNGAFRPESGVNRASALRLTLHPGDPGTPGIPSVDGAKQLTFDQMQSLPQIPAVALSEADAKPILENLGGPPVPVGWQGGLPLTYRLGGAKVKLALRIASDYRLRTITNVIAFWPGLEAANERLIVGCRRDAWTHGAAAAGSGTAALLEAARLIAADAAEGAPPRRTVMFASWDGSAYGALGSTEWAEEQASMLSREAALYIDLGRGVTGSRLRCAGSPSLAPSLARVLESVGDVEAVRGLSLQALGGGSPDALAFAAHLGIPTLALSSEGREGVRGSLYDTFRITEKFLDPGFRGTARLAGLTAAFLSRFSRSQFLPYDYAATARALAGAVNQVSKEHPELDLAEFRELLTLGETAARRVEAARRRLLVKPPPTDLTRKFNRRLIETERRLLLDDGAALRPWYRHLLWAPDPNTSPAARPLFPIVDALDAGDRDLAQREGNRVAEALRTWTGQLESTAGAFESALPQEEDSKP